MKERDRLVEQTLAFVQGVAAQRSIRGGVVDTPGLDTPGLDTPGLDTPGLDTPGLDVSDLDVSDLDVSVIEAPVTASPVTEPLTGKAAAPTDAISDPISDAIEIAVPSELSPSKPAGFAETDAESSETDMLISLIALSQSTDRIAPEPIAIAVPPRPIETKTPLRAKPHNRPPIEMGLPERDVIAQRVARFRAGQQKLIQDRDDNYALVQAKIRSTLGKTPSA